MTSRSALENRAKIAYYRAATRQNGGIGSVMEPSVDTVEHNGLTYIRLYNVHGMLAVYRVRTVKGVAVLKGLKRWPKALE